MRWGKTCWCEGEWKKTNEIVLVPWPVGKLCAASTLLVVCVRFFCQGSRLTVASSNRGLPVTGSDQIHVEGTLPCWTMSSRRANVVGGRVALRIESDRVRCDQTSPAHLFRCLSTVSSRLPISSIYFLTVKNIVAHSKSIFLCFHWRTFTHPHRVCFFSRDFALCLNFLWSFSSLSDVSLKNSCKNRIFPFEPQSVTLAWLRDGRRKRFEPSGFFDLAHTGKHVEFVFNQETILSFLSMPILFFSLNDTQSHSLPRKTKPWNFFRVFHPVFHPTFFLGQKVENRKKSEASSPITLSSSFILSLSLFICDSFVLYTNLTTTRWFIIDSYVRWYVSSRKVPVACLHGAFFFYHVCLAKYYSTVRTLCAQRVHDSQKFEIALGRHCR